MNSTRMDGNAWCCFTFLKSYAPPSTSLLSYELLGIDGMKMNPHPILFLTKTHAKQALDPAIKAMMQRRRKARKRQMEAALRARDEEAAAAAEEAAGGSGAGASDGHDDPAAPAAQPPQERQRKKSKKKSIYDALNEDADGRPLGLTEHELDRAVSRQRYCTHHTTKAVVK